MPGRLLLAMCINSQGILIKKEFKTMAVIKARTEELAIQYVSNILLVKKLQKI